MCPKIRGDYFPDLPTHESSLLLVEGLSELIPQAEPDGCRAYAAQTQVQPPTLRVQLGTLASSASCLAHPGCFPVFGEGLPLHQAV